MSKAKTKAVKSSGFKITLKKSVISLTKKQKETIRCLGLRKIGHSRLVNDVPSERGKIMMMQNWLEVERVASKDAQ